jgi:ABC-2 type transport system permease protein
VAIDPAHPDTIYAAMYARQRTPWSFASGPDETDGKDLGGIFKSIDGGAAWTKLEKGLPKATGRIGLAVYAIFCQVSLGGLCLLLIASVAAAMLFTGFQVIMASLTFFIGNSEGLASQAWNAFIHFSTYPSGIFRGVTKMLLFTLLPAGFINAVPVRVIRNFDPHYFALLLAAGVGFFALGWIVFFAGLRRYESGNLMTIRM